METKWFRLKQKMRSFFSLSYQKEVIYNERVKDRVYFSQTIDIYRKITNIVMIFELIKICDTHPFFVYVKKEFKRELFKKLMNSFFCILIAGSLFLNIPMINQYVSAWGFAMTLMVLFIIQYYMFFMKESNSFINYFKLLCQNESDDGFETWADMLSAEVEFKLLKKEIIISDINDEEIVIIKKKKRL